MIKPSEHVFIAGMTGSGKTYLADVYLTYISSDVFVLDTKGTFSFSRLEKDQYIYVNKLSDLEKTYQKIKKYTKFVRIIYRPIFQELTEEFYNEFFKYCYFKRNCIVVVDEAMQVCKNAHTLPEFYKGILTRGRELKVSVWSLSQRPATIPVAIISESTHLFIFRLNIITDRKRLVDITGYEEFYQIPQRYTFIYFNTTKSEKPYIGKITVKGGN